MSLLAGTLSLGDIRDVERLCQYVLTLEIRRQPLSPEEHEEAISHLIRTTYELWLRYTPTLDKAHTKGRKTSFQSYATYILRLRYRDWRTERNQEHRDKSLDQLLMEADAGRADHGAAAALAARTLDPQELRAASVRRLVE